MNPHRIYCLIFFRIAQRITFLLPRPLFHRVARLIGSLIYFSRPRLRVLLRKNLGRISGSRGRELEKLCRANIANFSRMLADYFYCTWSSPERIAGLLARVSGKERIEAALARKKGVLLVTAHLGNWELGGTRLGMTGLPLNVVTAHEPSEGLDAWRQARREKFGIKTITLGSDPFAFLQVINALKSNEIVAMLIDRPTGNSAIPVDFCGAPTLFSNAPALLHHHTATAVIPVFTLMNQEGKYVLFAGPEIEMVEMEKAGGKEQLREVLARNTQKLATFLGDLIRKHPDQWHNYIRIWGDENYNRFTSGMP